MSADREQCQARLDQLVDAFIRDDMPAYREACEWLRNYADARHRAAGRKLRGAHWFTDAGIDGMTRRIVAVVAARKHARLHRSHQKEKREAVKARRWLARVGGPSCKPPV